MTKQPTPLNQDIMIGAVAIAEFMFGDATETNKRRVYHAADKLGLPCFKIGGSLCARRSTIMKWIERKESEGISGSASEAADGE